MESEGVDSVGVIRGGKSERVESEGVESEGVDSGGVIWGGESEKRIE